MPCPELPIESVERIIDAASIHRATLLSCNAVCQAWLPRSRWNLYNIIDLSLFEDPARAALFVRTTHDAPYLAALVDTLTLEGPRRAYDYDALGPLATGYEDAQDPRARKWHAALGLRLLRNVRALHLAVSWLDCYEDFLAVLASFPLLDCLSIAHVHVRETWNAEVATRVQPLLQQIRSINRLEVYSSRFALPMVVEGCAPGGMFAQVASLELHDPHDWGAHGQWLHLPALLRGTLKGLSVSVTNIPRYDDMVDETPGVVLQRRLIEVSESLHGCTALRSLLIHHHPCSHPHLSGFRGAPFAVLARELRALPALREITLSFEGFSIGMLLPGLTDLSPALAKALHDRLRFPAVARVIVRVKNKSVNAEPPSTAAEQAAQVRASLAGFRDDTHVKLVVEVL